MVINDNVNINIIINNCIFLVAIAVPKCRF